MRCASVSEPKSSELTTAACIAGTVAPLAFSLRYAAPEVVAAYEANARTVHVDDKCDIWALVRGLAARI